jgi:hypothetical protein
LIITRMRAAGRWRLQLQAGRHEQALRVERRHPHAQHAHGTQVQVGGFLDRLAEARAQGLRALPELLRHRGELHAALAALEQREAQFLLQPLQPLGDSGLRDAQFGGRPARLALRRDCEEVVDVVQPHGHCGALLRVSRLLSLACIDNHALSRGAAGLSAGGVALPRLGAPSGDKS